MKVVATYSIKGGVGKTSAAVNLGDLAARAGLRTLLWDLDPQGGATYLLRVRPKVRGGGRKLVRDAGRRAADALRGTDTEGLDLLPSDFSYRHLDLVLQRDADRERGLVRVLDELRDEFDLAVLDCPPSVSLVSEAIFAAADLLAVPLAPAPLSVRTLDQLTDFLATTSSAPPQVLAFLSMVDRRRALHRELAATLPGRYPEVVGVSVPAAAAVERMGATRQPLGPGRDPARLAYAQLLAAIRDRLEV